MLQAAPRHFVPEFGLPGAGLPSDRLARIAAPRAFVRDLFGREVDDIDGYDLWVSTGSLTLEAAADVVISGYRSKFGAEVLTRLRT